MNGTALTIPRSLANALLADAQGHGGAYGLVGAREGRPTSLYPCAGPAGEEAILALLHDRGEQLFAGYRLLPESRSTPAAADWAGLEDAAWLLVLSTDTRGVLALRAFARDGRREVNLVLSSG
ncbi:hypothetical protein [Acidithiobacillus sulfuriphilus]|uniref:Uncharacterized protein n=2 Tax=Acidithiobacillus sulfuriphilus TaxID=1867749 RepID=A0A3M8QXW3_9PROT|nr:hypothetical protein [Acidithiobacillus sulfuriphilus]RNF60915.1 hypothetical protein EC580_08795 [Acidithiobacillus sulfuriphilus]